MMMGSIDPSDVPVLWRLDPDCTERECLFDVDEDGSYRCHCEYLVDDYDCSQLWPTTTSTQTEPARYCHGDSYKANDAYLMATAQDKSESQECNWLVTEDPEDCEMNVFVDVFMDVFIDVIVSVFVYYRTNSLYI